MSQITTHILDTSKGKPAANVPVTFHQQVEGKWMNCANGITNSDGRVSNLLPQEAALPLGIYKMSFEVSAYFSNTNTECFYPLVEIIFEIKTIEHYHIPLLISPFGFSTYRGS